MSWMEGPISTPAMAFSRHDFTAGCDLYVVKQQFVTYGNYYFFFLMVYSLSYFIVLSSNAILKIKRIFIKEKFAGLGIIRSSKIQFFLTE